MGKITLDPVLRAKLNGLNEEMEVRDENDKTIGMFLPQSEYNKLLMRLSEPHFTPEEMERRRNSVGGCSLAEIWSRLEKEFDVKINP
jgi:hypothetical protein